MFRSRFECKFSITLLPFKLSFGVTRNAYLPGIEARFTQGKRPGRVYGDSVGGSSKWTVLIGRTGFGTMSSVPDPTLSVLTLLPGVVCAVRRPTDDGERGRAVQVDCFKTRVESAYGFSA